MILQQKSRACFKDKFETCSNQVYINIQKKEYDECMESEKKKKKRKEANKKLTE